MAMQPDVAPPAEGEMPQGKGAAKLVVQINDMLQQLGALLDQSQVLDKSGMDKFSSIVSGYQDFVEHDLGSAQGEEPEEMPMPGNVPMETAGKPAKQAL